MQRVDGGVLGPAVRVRPQHGMHVAQVPGHDRGRADQESDRWRWTQRDEQRQRRDEERHVRAPERRLVDEQRELRRQPEHEHGRRTEQQRSVGRGVDGSGAHPSDVSKHEHRHGEAGGDEHDRVAVDEGVQGLRRRARVRSQP